MVFDGANVRNAQGWNTDGIGRNVDAISALFMHNHIFNEYVLDTVTKSGTDWVLTMPAGTFTGLPIIGFMAQSFTNGTLTTSGGSLIQANYAGTFNHRFKTLITP